jgi:hypothetical protein
MRVKYDEDYINDDEYEERLAEADALAAAGDCTA